jgi:phage FluMu protein Com
MLKVRCKNCNIILESYSVKAKCCGCDNLTTIKGETITAIDLSLVELISNVNSKQIKSAFTKDDLAFQESRRHRKVRKLDFEIK